MATHNRSRRIGAVVAAYWIGLIAFSFAPAGALAGQPAPAAGQPVRQAEPVGGEPAAVPEQPQQPAPAAGEPATGDEQSGEPQPPNDAPVVAEPGADEAGAAEDQTPVQAAAEGETTVQAAAESATGQTAVATAAAEAAAEQPVAAEEPLAEQTVAGEQPASEEPAAEPAGQPATAPAARVDQQTVRTPASRRITRGEVVRVGGSVTIGRDERVLGDVVVILGGVDVDGEVIGDVVVVGGSARFGPQAVARGDVTVVGGSLRRASSAMLWGSVTEVGLGGVTGFSDTGWWQVGWPGGHWFGSRDLFGTFLRLFFLGLLASGIVLVARAPVERIARRASAEPLKAGVVGLLAQMLAVPALVLGILGLVISIVGIPFLLLLPFVVMAVGLLMLVGFSGAVVGVGELARSRMGASGATVLASVWAGVALILLPTMAGEAVGMAGGLFRGLGLLLALTGFLLEYAAWTAGLGALILNRFEPGPPDALPSGGLPAGPPPSAPPPAPPAAPSPPAPPVDSVGALPATQSSAPPVDPVDKAPAPDPSAPPQPPEGGTPQGGRDDR